jgi:hypothetical protein
VVNKRIKLPLDLEEADLKMLSAVLNAGMTDLQAEEINQAVLERIVRSAG